MGFFYTGSSTTGFSSAEANSTFLTREGEVVSIAGTGLAFAFTGGAGSTYLLAGLAVSEDGDAVGTYGGAASLTVQVLATGAALGRSDGIELGGLDSQVINHGTVNGTDDAGVQFLAAGGRLENHGTVSGHRGLVADAGATAVNHGEIEGRGSNGATFGADGFLLNTGAVVGAFMGVTGGAAAGGLRVENLGLIATTSGDVYAALLGSAGADTVINAGRILGGVTLAEEADLLRNAGGEVLGEVSMGDGADQVLNRGGAILGDVDLGAGDDVYRGGAGSTLDGTLWAGDGIDLAVGGGGEEVFDGGEDADILRGKGGDDVLRGGGGADLLAGGAGDDEMDGGLGADVFRIGRRSGDDFISEFENNVDVVDLTRLSIDLDRAVKLVRKAAQAVESGVVIDLDALGGEGSLELQGMSVDQLGKADFLF